MGREAQCDEEVVVLARGIYLAATQPNLVGWGQAVDAWVEAGLDATTGPVIDEVNLLRRSWWHDGTLEDRAKCLGAIELLKRALPRKKN